nr:T-cell activation Rho GTPase-activating protein-like [Columba livia]
MALLIFGRERLAGLRDVASKLPEANLLLLKTLLSLLDKISSNVTVTRMTTSNLAICMGPNLLSPPEEDGLPLEVLMQVTGKVTKLVEFLIEHQEELFKEEEEEEAELPGPPAEAGSAGEQVEESPAPGSEGEAAEVPAVAPECEPQESSPGQSSCLPSSSQEGEAPSPRKRTRSCEEESDGPPVKRRRTLATGSSEMGK